LTPPPGSPPGWPGPCTERGVRAVEVRPSCEHAELPSCRRTVPGHRQCRAARGLTPLAGTLPSPAASESVFRYREDRCRTLQVGHWRSPRYAPWLSGGSSARFRVVSASHTMSRRKFKSHRSDLRSQPRLLELPPSGVSRDVVFGASHDTIWLVDCSCCSGGSNPICIPVWRAAGWFGVDPPHLRWAPPSRGALA